MSHDLQYTHPAPEHVDSWHLHRPDERPQEEHVSHTNAAVLAGAFVGSFLFVALVVLACYLYFQVQTTRLREVRIETTVLGKEARAYKEASLKQLKEYSFPNAAAARAGVVELPVQIAEQQVLARYSGANQNGNAAPAGTGDQGGTGGR